MKKEVDMEEIRQQEYDTNIPPSKPQQPHQKNEDAAVAGVTLLPFRIYLESGKETKTQIFASKDRSKWFEFILEKLARSNLQNKELIEKYLRHMYRQMYKGRTLDNSYGVIHHFLTYLQGNHKRPLKEVTRDDFEAFIEYEQDRGLKLSSVRFKLVILRAMIRFLIEQEQIMPKVLTRKVQIRLPEVLPKAIDPEDLKQFLSVVDKVRDNALFLLLLRTGMRIGELLSARVCDLNLKEQKIMIYQAMKTGSGRIVYYSEDAQAALKKWLYERDPAAEFLFYGHFKKKLTYGGAREIFLKYVRKAGLVNKGYTIHRLRHTFASELLNAGMRLEYLQTLLGHTSIEVTRRYARLTDKTREKEYFKAMERIERGEIDGHY
jgi:site-specific recombinase XerD